MALLESWKDTLETEKKLHTFYRFQGGHSFNTFAYNEQEVQYQNPNRYTYFSAGKKHHEYYTQKRVNQALIHLLDHTLPSNFLSHHNPKQMQEIPRLLTSLQNMEGINIHLVCFSFHFFEETFKLIWQNSYLDHTTKKEITNCPERVDSRIKGGGYGLNQDWLHLFYLSTFLTSVTPIEKQTLEKYLTDLTFSQNALLELKQKQRFYLSPKFLSPYTKYELADTLENIVETKTYNPNSPLAKEPKKTIKTFIKKYEETRNDAIIKLDEIL